MDNKKIVDMKYTVDENGKPVSATVIYDDNTWNNVINKPAQVTKWAAQVAKENSKEDIRKIMRRASSEDALRRALEADLARVDENGNQILHDGQTNDDTIEKIKDKHRILKRVGAGIGAAGVLGAVGYGAYQMGANGAETQNVATASTRETATEDELISDELKDRLQLTDFQREFLENAEATIDQYNSLCEKYNLDDDFKINLDEYLAAYINYNDLSINETKELIPMLMNVDNAETMDVNYIQTCLQSINSKFLGMSVAMTDPEDVSVFDGFIQDVTGSLTEREADMQGLTGEERENQLANLNKCRSIMREMWTHFVESNNSGELCGDDFYNFVSQSINEEVNGIPTGSAFYRMFADTYLTCGGIHSANYDEIINARTHEQRSFDDSTQENQNEMSLSDNVVTHSNKVCGSIDERIDTAWNDAREWFKETYAMMEEEGVTTDVKYYVNSEYNEEYNKLREKYKNIELFNVNDDEKAAKLADLVNNYLHTHGRSWDGNLSNYTTSVRGGGTTTTTTETWTEPAPANDVISSNKEEAYEAARQVIANDPTLSTVNANGDPMTQEQVDEWTSQMDQEAAKPPVTVTNPDGSTTTTDTVKNPDGSYTTKEETVAPPDQTVIETPVDGVIKDEDGNVVIENNQSAPTGNPETDHVKDLIEQAQKEEQEAAQNQNQSQNTSQSEVETPAQDTPVVEETPSAPEVEEPTIDNTPSAPNDGIPGDNTDVTTDANTDGSSVEVEVGDFVPITASDTNELSVDDYDAEAVENDTVFDESGNFTNEILESTIGTEPEVVVEATPEPVAAPVVETPAPTPVVETPAPVVETPAPVVEAPVVEEPVVEAPAPVEEPTSNVTIEVGGDVVTFDGEGNIASVEPAPVAEATNEDVKTM